MQRFRRRRRFVAIGELAAGLEIDLDKVPKKYAGLDGTEIAISESQERMAVVVDKKDVDQMMDYVAEENLEAVPVAVVTESPRLVMHWRGRTIVDISRAFLDTNGAHQEGSRNSGDSCKRGQSLREKRDWRCEGAVAEAVISLNVWLPEGTCGDV